MACVVVIYDSSKKKSNNSTVNHTRALCSHAVRQFIDKNRIITPVFERQNDNANDVRGRRKRQQLKVESTNLYRKHFVNMLLEAKGFTSNPFDETAYTLSAQLRSLCCSDILRHLFLFAVRTDDEPTTNKILTHKKITRSHTTPFFVDAHTICLSYPHDLLVIY